MYGSSPPRDNITIVVQFYPGWWYNLVFFTLYTSSYITIQQNKGKHQSFCVPLCRWTVYKGFCDMSGYIAGYQIYSWLRDGQKFYLTADKSPKISLITEISQTLSGPGTRLNKIHRRPPPPAPPTLPQPPLNIQQ